MALRTVPWLELILGSALALWLGLVLLLQVGVSTITAILWLFVLAVAIVGLAMILIHKEHQYGKMLLIAAGVIAIVVVIVTTDVQKQYLPICGDGACHPSECSRGCGDCSAAQCQDSICTVEIENCATSIDCSCASGLACAPARGGAKRDLRGCVTPSCGDGFCDRAVESTDSCCTDCGCKVGFSCSENLCYYHAPSISTTTYLIATQIAATSLAVNPTLTDEYGSPHAFATVTMDIETSVARNTTVTFSFGNIATSVKRLGDVHQGDNVTVDWVIAPKDIKRTPLTVTTDTVMNLSTNITYFDAQKVMHSRVTRVPVHVLARDAIDDFGHMAFFVTPGDVSVRGTSAASIWDEIGARAHIGDPVHAGRVRFPAETLATGQGSADELAVLIASAFQRANLDPAFVESDVGTLVRVRDEGKYYLLDPALLGSSFEEAISDRPGYTLEDVDRVWRDRNSTAPIALNQALIPGALLRVESQRSVTCVCAPECGPRVVGVATVTNDGDVAVPVCVVSTIYSFDEVLDSRETCVSLAAHEEREFRHGWQGVGACDPTGIRVVVDARSTK